MKPKVPVRAVIEMSTADAPGPVPVAPAPPGGRPARWPAAGLIRAVRLVLWAAVILLLAGGGLAYGCAPAHAVTAGCFPAAQQLITR